MGALRMIASGIHQTPKSPHPSLPPKAGRSNAVSCSPLLKPQRHPQARPGIGNLHAAAMQHHDLPDYGQPQA
jgi:hypothetical protein